MPHLSPVAPCDFLVFGGTGDLAMRKLLPALYLRDRDGQLAVAITEVQGGQQLAHGEIAGAAEYEEVARGDRGQVRQSRLLL